MSEGIPKRPKLRKVYGAPSINANEDLANLIEDYNKIEEWFKEVADHLEKLLASLEEKQIEAYKAEGLDDECASYEIDLLEPIIMQLKGLLEALR